MWNWLKKSGICRIILPITKGNFNKTLLLSNFSKVLLRWAKLKVLNHQPFQLHLTSLTSNTKMNTITTRLKELFARIPRRHTPDNVKEIYNILDEYEDLLRSIEAESDYYEKNVPPFFDALDPIRAIIKKSSDNKASKKNKDSLFDEASGALKDTMEALTTMYAAVL